MVQSHCETVYLGRHVYGTCRDEIHVHLYTYTREHTQSWCADLFCTDQPLNILPSEYCVMRLYTPCTHCACENVV